MAEKLGIDTDGLDLGSGDIGDIDLESLGEGLEGIEGLEGLEDLAKELGLDGEE